MARFIYSIVTIIICCEYVFADSSDHESEYYFLVGDPFFSKIRPINEDFRLPENNGQIDNWFSKNIVDLERDSIPERNYRVISPYSRRFCWIMEYISGIDLTIADITTKAYYNDLEYIKIPNNKITQLREWWNDNKSVVTLDIILDASTLHLAPEFRKQQMRNRIKDRMNFIKTRSEKSTESDCSSKVSNEGLYPDGTISGAIESLQRAFLTNNYVVAITPSPLQIKNLHLIIKKMNNGGEVAEDDLKILTRDKLIDIEEWFFRNPRANLDVKNNALNYREYNRIFNSK